MISAAPIVPTQLSIDIECLKEMSMVSSHIIEEQDSELTEWKIPHPSFARVHKKIEKDLKLPYLSYTNQNWNIEITDIQHRNDEHKIT